MMSKFKLEFKLKQHTPLIHFQHHQSGATLRATELKPKLDKFLKIKKLDLPFGKDGDLDYKVKIKTPNNIEINDITPPKIDRATGAIQRDREGNIKRHTYPNFFANLGDDIEKYKKTSYTNTEILVEFFTFRYTVIDAIKQYFPEFILKTNFGTRQSKGFGSFYLDSTDANYVSPSLKYKFTVNSKDDKQLFHTIEIFYKTLRSGINLKNRAGDTTFYFKSLMFLYAKKQFIQWDKKSIKEACFSGQLGQQQSKYEHSDVLSFSSENKNLMKDLLGLSSAESWLSYRETINKEHADIDRFKSPITFKPIKNNNGYDVYFFAEKINADFLDKSFNIQSKSTKTLNLKTPKIFDCDVFLDFAIKVDLDKHVDTIFHNTQEYNLLKKIYADINSNNGAHNG